MADFDNIAVPQGEWVDVRRGQIMAEGTYVDKEGVLRSVTDDSVCAWHWKPKHCTRKGLEPSDLVYDPETGAPWCPECWPVRRDFYEVQAMRDKLKETFGTRPNHGTRS